LKFGESSPAPLAVDFAAEPGCLLPRGRGPHEPAEPKEEELDMEQIIGIFEKYGMRFPEEAGH
jgi:hypothetical protein